MIVRYGLRRIVGVVVAAREQRPASAVPPAGGRPHTTHASAQRTLTPRSHAAPVRDPRIETTQEHPVNALINEELARQRHREAHLSAQRYRHQRSFRDLRPRRRATRVLSRVMRPARAN